MSFEIKDTKNVKKVDYVFIYGKDGSIIALGKIENDRVKPDRVFNA